MTALLLFLQTLVRVVLRTPSVAEAAGLVRPDPLSLVQVLVGVDGLGVGAVTLVPRSPAHYPVDRVSS
jgi:hypothetical protein